MACFVFRTDGRTGGGGEGGAAETDFFVED